MFIGPWYLLLIAFFCMTGDLLSGIIWSLVITVSILVHEFGHGTVAKIYGLHPRILLHGLGGLTFHQHARTNRHDALIVAAGPAAGLVLGALTFAYWMSGVSIAQTDRGLAIEQMVVESLLYVNIFWSFVNLLPLYPLDGGKLFRLGLLKFLKPGRAERITYGVGIAMSAVWIAVSWLVLERMFLSLLGIWLLADNLKAWQGGGGEAVRSENRYAKELHKRARAAFDQGNYAEAARLGQRIRAENNVGEKVLRDTWMILGVSYARQGQHEEALSFLKRAPSSAAVTEALVECFHQLGRRQELDEVLASEEFQKISPERREQILAILRGE